MLGTGLEPRWASPPGATILSALEERDVSLSEFGIQIGLDQSEVRRLLVGDLPITVDIARGLVDAVGASTAFWLTRDAQYLEDKARVQADRWSNQLPISQMVSFGWVENPKTWQERISVSLDFFGIADVETWEAQYERQVFGTRYRTSPSFDLKSPATTVWFREAERVVDARGNLPVFDPEGFAGALPSVRHMTRQHDPEKFIPDLVGVGAEHGVHIAVVRAPSGCTASGACRTYNGRPLIQLSARYLADDHFWFTFFHEAGHVLHHSLEQGFVDMGQSMDDDVLEREANEFATECLIGPNARQFYQPDSKRWSHRDVIREAVALDVAPGVLVSQLQHADVLPKSHLNRVKRRYRWDRNRLLAVEIL